MSHAVVWRDALLAVLIVSAVPLVVLAVLARREDAVRRAVLYHVWTALVSLAGATLTLAIGTHTASMARALLPFAAGNFLYIAAALLVPLLRRPGSRALVLGRMGLIALGLVATGVPALFR